MRILRDTLVAVLRLEDGMEVVAEVTEGTGIVPGAESRHADVAVVDIDLPGTDGLTAAAELHERCPACKVRANRAQHGCGGPTAPRGPGGDQHAHARLGEPLRDGSPDSFIRSRYHGDGRVARPGPISASCEREGPDRLGHDRYPGGMDAGEIRELRYFVALAEELHFGRAAQRLGIAHPPLSRAIRQLERRLGVMLVERTSRAARLTAAGEVLLHDRPAALDAVTAATRPPHRAGAHPPRA